MLPNQLWTGETIKIQRLWDTRVFDVQQKTPVNLTGAIFLQ